MKERGERVLCGSFSGSRSSGINRAATVFPIIFFLPLSLVGGRFASLPAAMQ